MQLDEQLHQHIELLPLELKAEVLDFVLFLEQKQERQAKESLTEAKQQELMATIKAIKPVKAPLSSEEIVRHLRAGKDHEIAKIIEAKKGHTPITQNFIGLLVGSDLDENDYKKHLEEKYL